MPSTSSTMVITATKGISIKSVFFLTASGVITEAMPRIRRTLRMLLPTTLLTASSALPLIPAVILMAASGALVPKATIVRPITICGMPSLPARLEEPSTNTSAPFIRSTKPTTNNKILTGNGIFKTSVN